MANPCFCGCSLKTASLVIAIINMIVSALSFFVTFIFGVALVGIGVTAASKVTGSFKVPLGAEIGVGIAIVVVFLIVCVLMFYLALTLKRGADQEDLRKCRIWFIVTVILLVLGVVGFFGMIAVELVDEVNIWGYLIGFVYNAFSLWVVYEFMNALKSGQRFDTATTAVYTSHTAVYSAGGVLKV